jgi:hypothetical protein
VSVIDIWCVTCAAVRPHVVSEDLMACAGCSKICHGLGEGLAIAAFTVAELPPVDDMRPCAWCRETLPVDHDCPAGAVGCENNPPDGPTCGRCEPCCRAQAQSLAARDAEFRRDPYGSPSDIDIP